MKYGRLRCFHSSEESLRRWLPLFCFSHQEPSWAGVCITFISEPPAEGTGVLWCFPNNLSTVYHCNCPGQYVLFYILKVNSHWNTFFLKANPSGAVKYIRFDVLGHEKPRLHCLKSQSRSYHVIWDEGQSNLWCLGTTHVILHFICRCDPEFCQRRHLVSMFLLAPVQVNSQILRKNTHFCIEK